MPNLDLKVPSKLLFQTPENGDEVLAAIYKYQNHPSIKTILEKCNFSFSFKIVSLTDIEKEMKSLNSNKASHSSDIPTKILKQYVDLFSPFIIDDINKSVSSSIFPSILKLQTSFQYIKKICYWRKVTISLSVSYQLYLKSLKMISVTKFLIFFENILSKVSPSCLVAMIEKFKKSLDQGGEHAVLLTDLSKAFDWLSHDLIINPTDLTKHH